MASSRKFFAPSADRNKDPILEILQKYLSDPENSEIESMKRLRGLEISSGSGQHVVHFAKYLPFITFQPSEFTVSNLPSIEEYITESGLINILPPLHIDVTQPVDEWNLTYPEYDLIININMIHISPWACTLALFEKAAQLLSPNGLLITYGPYADHGVISPESNVAFDLSLKSRNDQWGLRDIQDLKQVAITNGLKLEAIEEMPSNNKTIIWKRI